MSNKLGLSITESQYRKLELPSYSLLSAIEEEGPRVLLYPRPDISMDEPVIIGSIVDNYLTDGDNIKKTFIVPYIPSDKPKDIILDLIDNIDNLDDKINILSDKNSEIIDFYCNKYDYYKTYNTRIKYLKKFQKFIQVLLDNRGKDKPFIITNYQKKQADEVIEAVQRTFPFFNYRNNLGQLKLKGTVNGQELKVMFDMVLIDNKNKRLIPFDLKTGVEEYEQFISGNFVKYNYYIQAALYKIILTQNLEGTKYEGWSVEDFRFLYCSRIVRLPMIFKVGPDMHEKALKGFTSRDGVYKKGLYELIEEYKFYKKNPRNKYRKDFIKTNSTGKLFLEKDIVL